MRSDAIVVGGGIVGAACALALARAGAKVLVLESQFAAGGTTAAGMGHIVAMDDSPEQLALTAYSEKLWNEFVPSLPPEVEHQACGTLWVAEDEAQLAALPAKRRAYNDAGIPAEVIGSAEVAKLEPNLRRGLAGALLVASDSVVYPPGAALRVLEMARDLGATVRENSAVQRIADNCVHCGGEQLRAEIIVNAAGAAAPQLIPELPIVPRKGHLVITDRDHGFCNHQLLELGYQTSAHRMTNESVAFNVQPRATGQVLIGSSRELVGWDASINPRIVRQMLERAYRFMPAIADLSAIRTWTGFRPATADNLPLIGRWEPLSGVWVAAGHEGLGITTSLGTGALIADLATGRSPAIDAAPLSPMRVLARTGAAA